jgi:hypothetical protein
MAHAPEAPQALHLATKLLEHFGDDQLYCLYNIQTNKKEMQQSYGVGIM